MTMHTQLYSEAQGLKKISEMFRDLAQILPPTSAEEAVTYWNAATMVGQSAARVMSLAGEAQKVQDGD